MKNHPLITALSATILLLLGMAFAQAGDDFAGTFSDGRLSLVLTPEAGAYRGEILVDGQRFPTRAQRSGQGLVGEFETASGTFAFEAYLDGSVLVLLTGGASYSLQPAGASQASGGSSNFRSQTPANGLGQLLLGSVSATSATDGLLRATEELLNYFDPYPIYLGGISDRQGTLIQAPFTATIDGLAVSGVAVAHLSSPGMADIGFALDVTERAPQTMNGLMRELGQHLPLPQPAAPAAAGPALTWHTVPFPDGSGRLSLPESWVLTSASQGMADASGPSGAEIHLGLWAPISTPEVAINPMTGQPYPGILAAPLLNPADAVGALFPQMFASFGTDYRVSSILDYAPTSTEVGGQSAFILWDATINGRTYRHLGLVITSPVSYEQWLFYYSYVAALVESFSATLPTMMEIWGRWNINPALFRQRLQSAAQSMQETGQIIIDSFEANQQSIDGSAYSWSEAFRGDGIIRDTETGDEGSAALGWIDQTIGAMNQGAGYDRFEYVPLDEWWLRTTP